MHLLDEDDQPKRALLVAYNPSDKTQSHPCNLTAPGFQFSECAWRYTSESGTEGTVTNGVLPVTVPAFNATWFELIEKKDPTPNA
jgi:hypothetical protein